MSISFRVQMKNSRSDLTEIGDACYHNDNRIDFVRIGERPCKDTDEFCDFGLTIMQAGIISQGGQRATNCGMPDDDSHACWKPILIDKNLVALLPGCGVGGGSIGGKYGLHAYMREGVYIVDAVPNNNWGLLMSFLRTSPVDIGGQTK